ncbi:hypothetical protein RAS12_21065 [Achromobacter seleniivolatilans]|uniref:Poly-beta-1,6-N-acetyl-D-glucosamine biosynthesis protein PgaD n=1 Tax=Achromobacter seleniivolatilans TaxID=3047478 RepID=A0ABY9LXL3_9BURK|nr:hypothetical protein [Achromobacter sp. R39]WMD19098.1 hypothetical protein RAS12_21065 [Achromobacter sp. R39]
MMNLTSPASVRQDCRLIGQTLLKLALPRLVVRAIVIAVALVLWYLVASWILDFGKRMNYDFLHSLGQPTMDMVQKVAPYIWWVAAGIWSLIVFFSVRAWFSASLAAGSATPVGTDVLANLAPNLSEESLGVLRWTWGDRQEPFTVGDLRRSLSEIRHNRIAKIEMVADQAQILDASASRPSRDPRDESRREPRSEVRGETRGDRYVEPRIGGTGR